MQAVRPSVKDWPRGLPEFAGALRHHLGTLLDHTPDRVSQRLSKTPVGKLLRRAWRAGG